MTTRRAIFQLGGAGAIGALAGCNSEGGQKTGPATVAIADVPVGGGVILRDAGYVVTQPEAGTFRAFTNQCTHSTCKVSSIDDRGIVCPCHGSTFALKDGSVVRGPAEKPLAEVKITQDGDKLTLG